MENRKMNKINITNKFIDEGVTNIIEELNHFNYNGIDGEYIKESYCYGTNKYLRYGDLTAVATKSGRWIVEGNLTDELASVFNSAFKENFKAKEGITVLSYKEESRSTDYLTATWYVFYNGKRGLIEVEYDYGNGGHPEYLNFRLGEISGIITETMVDLSKDIPAEVLKRIEDITRFDIHGRLQ